MRSFYIFISLFISGFAFSHDYYFSFAEIQYNKETTCLEISIKVSSHDLETYFRKKITDVSIEKARKVDSLSHKINQFILDGFVIKQQEKQLLLSIDGYENNLDGYTYFYLKSEPLHKEIPMLLKYDLFMDLFPEQQQKVTLIGDTISSYQFMLFQREQTINLN